VNDQNKHIDKLTPEVIEKYLRGELTHSAMHEVEKLMLHNDFEAEAMEGFENINPDQIAEDLTAINKRIETKVNHSTKKGIAFYLKIAATILLIAVSTFMVTMLFDSTISDSEISQAEPEQTQDQAEESPKISETKPEQANREGQRAEPANEVNPPTEKETRPGRQQEEAASDEDQLKEEIEVENLQGITMAEEHDGEVSMDRSMEKVPQQISGDEALRNKTSGIKAESTAPARQLNAKSKKITGSQVYSDYIENKKLEGKVTSAEDGKALPGVNVIVKGTSTGTVTDINGNYKIKIPQGADSTLVFSFIGLATNTIDASGKGFLDVQMASDVQQLSEVVVSGYDASQDDNSYESTFEPAQPAIGKSDYKDYLERNTRYPANHTDKGRVVIKFKVNANGTLSDFEITKSMGQEYDVEAIRLIKEGPNWKAAKRDDMPVEDYVKVKVKFDPEQ